MTLCNQRMNIYSQITLAGYLKICLFISVHNRLPTFIHIWLLDDL